VKESGAVEGGQMIHNKHRTGNYHERRDRDVHPHRKIMEDKDNLRYSIIK
jgi:hypothetical protein